MNYNKYIHVMFHLYILHVRRLYHKDGAETFQSEITGEVLRCGNHRYRNFKMW